MEENVIAMAKANRVSINMPVTDEQKAQLREADLIFGYELFTESLNLFYGRGYLRDIAAQEREGEATVLAFAYDQRTEELEYLSGMVIATKGRCEYVGSKSAPMADPIRRERSLRIFGSP